MEFKKLKSSCVAYGVCNGCFGCFVPFGSLWSLFSSPPRTASPVAPAGFYLTLGLAESSELGRQMHFIFLHAYLKSCCGLSFASNLRFGCLPIRIRAFYSVETGL